VEREGGALPSGGRKVAALRDAGVPERVILRRGRRARGSEAEEVGQRGRDWKGGGKAKCSASCGIVLTLLRTRLPHLVLPDYKYMLAPQRSSSLLRHVKAHGV
jgi:hypothetical protein